MYRRRYFPSRYGSVSSQALYCVQLMRLQDAHNTYIHVYCEVYCCLGLKRTLCRFNGVVLKPRHFGVVTPLEFEKKLEGPYANYTLYIIIQIVYTMYILYNYVLFLSLTWCVEERGEERSVD